MSAAFEAGRPVVLVPRDRDDPSGVVAGATWERRGDLYRLIALETPPVPQTDTPD